MLSRLCTWLLLAACCLGLVSSAMAEPKGELVYAMHVTIAPAWFDRRRCRHRLRRF